mgnify:CR=1 FL=1
MGPVNQEAADVVVIGAGIVGLMATGGSTNLVMHIPAMAKAAGIQIDIEDFNDISESVPLMARVYPNGLADVNHFHAAGGIGYMIGQLLDAGLLHPDVKTINGTGLDGYTAEPKLDGDGIRWDQGVRESLNDRILRPASNPFAATGGLKQLNGNLGRGVIKISAVAEERHVIEAKARVFDDQEQVKAAFKAGEFTEEQRPQGPQGSQPCPAQIRPAQDGLCVAERLTETLPNGVSHDVLKLTDNGPGDNTPEFVVPEGQYFFLGDNRDNSGDSRWPASAGGVGMVPAEYLIGRADRIMFSSAGKSLLYFWTWRGDRFFKAVN